MSTAAKTALRKTASKTPGSKTQASKKATVAPKPAPPEKDPQGGLTAAGRAAFAAKDGSRLRPGVTKSDAEMSPEDMKRKGSWAVRFYGRASLPPLVDDKGEPTRFALSAHAWGEPVPKTEAAARRIAEKGRRLLERCEGDRRTGSDSDCEDGGREKGAGSKARRHEVTHREGTDQEIADQAGVDQRGVDQESAHQESDHFPKLSAPADARPVAAQGFAAPAEIT